MRASATRGPAARPIPWACAALPGARERARGAGGSGSQPPPVFPAKPGLDPLRSQSGKRVVGRCVAGGDAPEPAFGGAATVRLDPGEPLVRAAARVCDRAHETRTLALVRGPVDAPLVDGRQQLRDLSRSAGEDVEYVGPRRLALADLSAAQVRAAQVRAAQVRAAQVRDAQDRAAQVRAAQVRAAQVRAAQVRAASYAQLQSSTDRIAIRVCT